MEFLNRNRDAQVGFYLMSERIVCPALEMISTSPLAPSSLEVLFCFADIRVLDGEFEIEEQWVNSLLLKDTRFSSKINELFMFQPN